MSVVDSRSSFGFSDGVDRDEQSGRKLSFDRDLRHLFTPLSERLNHGVQFMDDVLELLKERISLDVDMVERMKKMISMVEYKTSNGRFFEIGSIGAALGAINNDIRNECTARTVLVNSLSEDIYKPLAQLREVYVQNNRRFAATTKSSRSDLHKARNRWHKIKAKWDKAVNEAVKAKQALVGAKRDDSISDSMVVKLAQKVNNTLKNVQKLQERFDEARLTWTQQQVKFDDNMTSVLQGMESNEALRLQTSGDCLRKWAVGITNSCANRSYDIQFLADTMSAINSDADMQDFMRESLEKFPLTPTVIEAGRASFDALSPAASAHSKSASTSALDELSISLSTSTRRRKDSFSLSLSKGTRQSDTTIDYELAIVHQNILHSGADEHKSSYGGGVMPAGDRLLAPFRKGELQRRGQKDSLSLRKSSSSTKPLEGPLAKKSADASAGASRKLMADIGRVVSERTIDISTFERPKRAVPLRSTSTIESADDLVRAPVHRRGFGGRGIKGGGGGGVQRGKMLVSRGSGPLIRPKPVKYSPKKGQSPRSQRKSADVSSSRIVSPGKVAAFGAFIEDRTAASKTATSKPTSKFVSSKPTSKFVSKPRPVGTDLPKPPVVAKKTSSKLPKWPPS